MLGAVAAALSLSALSVSGWVSTVADAVAALGTAGALMVSLYLLWDERKLRLREQASKVAVWVEWERSLQHDTTPRQFFAYVKNSSDDPVYVEALTIDDNPEPAVVWGTVPGHELTDDGLDVGQFPPSGEVPSVAIEFLDVNRVLWRRDSKGALVRIGAHPPE